MTGAAHNPKTPGMTKHPLHSFLLAALLFSVSPASAAVIFSENFEGTGLAPNSFTTANVGGSMGAFTVVSGSGNLLNPGAGNAWLNPVPAELGTTFAVLPNTLIIDAAVGQNYEANTLYTLSFTRFRRNDIAPDGLGAQLLAPGPVQVAGQFFPASDINATGFLSNETISILIEDGSPFIGQPITVRFFSQQDTTGNTPQVALDNIVLTAVLIPEPSRALLAVVGLATLLFRRRR